MRRAMRSDEEGDEESGEESGEADLSVSRFEIMET